MPLEPLTGRRQQREDILRAVYEDNLKPDRSPMPALPARRAPRWRTVVAGFIVLVVALVGLGLYRSGEAGAAATPQIGPTTSTITAPRRPVSLAERLSSWSSVVVPNPIDTAQTATQAVTLTQAGLPLARVLGLGVQTIVLDPGHGGEDPGALGAEGTLEKDITLDIARRLRTHLEHDYGYRILMTRDTDEKVSLKDRVTYANAQGADLFVSIHVNALPDPEIAPIETYYFGTQADAAALRSAERENQDSEYSLADFKDIIQEIGNTIKLQESQRLAGSIQSSLIRNMRQVNPRLSNWGVKTAPFVVLLGVEAPAVLTEVAALSHPDDEARLASDAYREQLAGSLAQGVARYLEIQPETSSTTD